VSKKILVVIILLVSVSGCVAPPMYYGNPYGGMGRGSYMVPGANGGFDTFGPNGYRGTYIRSDDPKAGGPGHW
jgi:hypothetical protein